MSIRAFSAQKCLNLDIFFLQIHFDSLRIMTFSISSHKRLNVTSRLGLPFLVRVCISQWGHIFKKSHLQMCTTRGGLISERIVIWHIFWEIWAKKRNSENKSPLCSHVFLKISMKNMSWNFKKPKQKYDFKKLSTPLWFFVLHIASIYYTHILLREV